MKNKIKIIILFIIIIFISTIIIIVNKKIINSQKKALYEISFYDESIPGTEYKIYIYDSEFKVESLNFCSALDCQPSKGETKVYKYSKENMNKLKQFLQEDLKMKKYETKEIWLPELSDYEQEVLTTLYLNEVLFEISVEKYQYKFTYGESMNKEYNFYFKENKTILVKVLNINDDYEIIEIDTYQINFNKENTQKLFNYAKKLTEENDGYNYHKSGILYKNEKNIYLSLTKNNESYLEEKEIDLLYEIKYKNIECNTPYIRLYDDNTYEYFDTYTSNDTLPIPKNGIYDYNIDKIIKSIEKNETQEKNKYKIITSDKKEYIIDNNIELNNFLDKYNFSLKECMIKEGN